MKAAVENHILFQKEPSQLKMIRKYSGTILRITISLALIYYLVNTQDLPSIWESVRQFNLSYLILALVLILSGTIISAWRWQTILESSKVKVSLFELYQLYLKGYFYNNFLPTQMGGDVYKSVALGRKIKDQSLSLFSVFIDRFSGLIVLLIIGLFGIGSLYGAYGIALSLLLLVVGLLLYFPVLRFFAKRIKFLIKFEEASQLLWKDKKRAGLLLFQSLIVQTFSFAMVYVLFLGIGVVLPFWSVIAFMPITALALLIPSINGLGTQDAVYMWLFAGVGVTEPLSLTVSIMIHVTRLILSLIGGLLLVFKF